MSAVAGAVTTCAEAAPGTRMRKQHEINWRQLAHGKRRMNQPLGANRADAQVRAYAPEQHRVSQNVNAKKIDQHGRMAEPARRQRILFPRRGQRAKTRARNWAAGFGHDPRKQARGTEIGPGRPKPPFAKRAEPGRAAALDGVRILL